MILKIIKLSTGKIRVLTDGAGSACDLTRKQARSLAKVLIAATNAGK